MVGVGALIPTRSAGAKSARTSVISSTDVDVSADHRAAALVTRMTLDEKISMVHGVPSDSYVGYVPGVARLNVPALLLTDGPAGIRTPKQTNGPSTAFPAPIALAACFDVQLAGRVGRALGSEAKAKGQNVVFAPIVNLARVPEGGRLFEGFGEDPILTSDLGVEVIDGIQSMGVIATVKHWICNDQEDDRHLVSATVSERTLREVYLPPFVAAIKKARVGSVMAANNRTNGTYNAQNVPLLRTLLKDELGFDGFVCSDYAATHNTIAAAWAGLDLDLPTDLYFGAPLLAAIEAGTVSMAVLDDKVHRLVRTMIAFGIFDGNGTSQRGGPGAVNTVQHAALAQQVAERGTVLAKNEPRHGRALLPMRPNAKIRIAVVGPFAAIARIGGDGSSLIIPTASISPVEGITARFPNATVTTAPGAYASFDTVPTTALHPPDDLTDNGLLGQYFANNSFKGSPALTRIDALINESWVLLGPGDGLPTTNFSVRWTGTLTPTITGTHTIATRSDDGSLVWIDGALVVDNGGEHDVRRRSGTIHLNAGQAYDLRIDYVQRTFRASIILQWILPADDLIAAAVEAARGADVVLVCVSDIESEGIDRENLALPGQQNQLIDALVAHHPHSTIVVGNVGGPVTMPWVARVRTVLIAWYAGQQDGAALARVLAGDVDPGGRLPVTFGRHESDYPARTAESYPGVDFVEHYREGAFIGYRHFDAQHIEPMFCFGHGLSYTSFRYERFRVTKHDDHGSIEIRVQVTVVNTGDCAGDEVVQLYLGQPAHGVPTPVQVLRKFTRVHLRRGERKMVDMTLTAEDLSRWGVHHHHWYVPRGSYRVAVGSSSRHIRASHTVTIPHELPGAG